MKKALFFMRRTTHARKKAHETVLIRVGKIVFFFVGKISFFRWCVEISEGNSNIFVFFFFQIFFLLALKTCLIFFPSS